MPKIISAGNTSLDHSFFNENGFDWNPKSSGQMPLYTIEHALNDPKPNPDTYTSGKIIHTKSDRSIEFHIREKHPLMGVSPADTGYIFPLGGNLRGYPIQRFRAIRFNGTTDYDEISAESIQRPAPDGYSLSIGGHWKGSFSYVGDTSVNLISNSSLGWSASTHTLGYSILNSEDRHYLEGNSSVTYNRTFEGLEPSTYYCFSFYSKVRGSSRTLKNNGWGTFILGKGLETSNGNVTLNDYYTRLALYGQSDSSGRITLNLTFGQGGDPILLDVCGICLNKGKYPIDIFYNNDGKKHPILIKYMGEGGLGNNWTICYTRNSLGQVSSKEILCGLEFSWNHDNSDIERDEIVVITHNSSNSTVVYTDGDQPSIKGVNPINIGSNYYDILLGGYIEDGNVFIVPGIYRNLIVIPRVLESNEIKSLRNTVMTVGFVNSVPILSNSLFEEVI